MEAGIARWRFSSTCCSFAAVQVCDRAVMRHAVLRFALLCQPRAASAVRLHETQYRAVPGWNVRQLCQNSWLALIGASDPAAPLPLSA